MPFRYDAIIVGARCAGASTALLLARSGLSVLVLDRDAEGSDTVSTHALMRGGVLQLHRWGVLPALDSASTPPIRTTTFHYGREALEIAIKPKDGIDALYAPRRTVLDPALVAAARIAGAVFVHGLTAVDLVRDADGRVRGTIVRDAGGQTRTLRADLVIGADGVRSRIARLARAAVERRGDHASSLIYGYFEGLEMRGFQWFYDRGVSIGVIPTNGDLTCVFVAVPGSRFRASLASGLEGLYREALLQASPDLASAVATARRTGRLVPFPGLPGFLRRPCGPGWALVGDSGFYRDPITAHGITDALRDAELLTRAVLPGTDGAFADYHAHRDTFAVPMMKISDAVASFAWSVDRVKVLHLELSRCMNAEVDFLRGLTSSGREPGFATTRAVVRR